jgi:hypothetical protein
MSDWISREAAVAICDEAACETDSESARYEMFRARAAIRALPAVQPDAAAILQERPDSLDRVARAICLASYGDANPVPVPDELMPNAWERLRDRYALLAEAAILALIDNAGKEVMPDAAQSPPAGHDIGPGDQAVAGAAPRRASGPIDSDAGFATSGAEARWIADIDAGVYDDAQPAPWPENLFGLTGDTLHLRCATEGCGRRVSTRFAGSDYCEPCGRKVALAQKGDSHER